MRTVMTIEDNWWQLRIIDDNEENTDESKWTVNRRSIDLNQLHILNICNDDDVGDDATNDDDGDVTNDDDGNATVPMTVEMMIIARELWIVDDTK